MCSSRFCLVFINVIFLVVSTVLLVIGAIIQASLDGNYGLFRGHLNIPAALTLAFGSFLLATSVLALLSVFCRSNSLLSAYICMLVLLIVIELSVGIAGFVTKSPVLSLITDTLRSAESKYTGVRFVKVTWDSVQRNLKCCGVYHYKEWFRYLGNSSIPDTCCTIYTIDCGRVAVPGYFYETGCSRAISAWADSHEITIAVLYSCIVTLHLVCLLCLKRYLRVPQHPDYVSDEL